MEFLDSVFEAKNWSFVEPPVYQALFVSEEYAPILLHKPHPRKELLEYQVKQLIEVLEKEGLI